MPPDEIPIEEELLSTSATSEMVTTATTSCAKDKNSNNHDDDDGKFRLLKTADDESKEEGLRQDEPEQMKTILQTQQEEQEQRQSNCRDHGRLMEYFPLDEDELAHLMRAYDKGTTAKSATGMSLSSSSLPSKTTSETTTHVSTSPLFSPLTIASIFGLASHQNDNNHNNIISNEEDDHHREKKEDGGSSSIEQNGSTDADQHLEDGATFRRRLLRAGEEFLPEAASILQMARDNVFLIGSGNDESDEYLYLEAIVTLLGRRGSRLLSQIIFHVVVATQSQPAPPLAPSSPGEGCRDNGMTDATTASPDDLADFVFRLILCSCYLKTGYPTIRRHYPRSWTTSLSDRGTSSSSSSSSSMGSSRRVTLSDWTTWVDSVAPQVYQALSTVSHIAIFGHHHPFRPHYPPLSLPQVSAEQAHDCALWTVPYQGIPASLSILSTKLGGPWIRLYSSDLDGCSYLALRQAVLSYRGPTVILIQTTAGDAFGYYSDRPWKESKHWFGGPVGDDGVDDGTGGGESFLFGLKPALKYYGVVAPEMPYHKFLHNPLYPHPGDLYGMAMGGVSDKTPRVLITTTLEGCEAGTIDSVYASGPLLSNGEVSFDVDVVEVFAVQCTEPDQFDRAVRDGKAAAAIREGTRIKAAKVDRKQFLEDFQSGHYMNHLFAHRDQTRGRHSFVAHDEPSQGYFKHDKRPSTRFLSVRDEDFSLYDDDDSDTEQGVRF